MGNCESQLMRRSRRAALNQSQVIPKCTFLDAEVCTRVDQGYSFIDLELSAEQVLATVPVEKRILINVRGKVVCFDCVELYAWLRTNPKANLEGPFGSLYIDEYQKRHIVTKAENYLPVGDQVEQKESFDWNMRRSDLGNVEKHLPGGDQHLSTADDVSSIRSDPEAYPEQDICSVICQVMVNEKGTIHSEKVIEAVDSMIVRDREQAALQLVDMFAAHDLVVDAQERCDILTHCVHNRALGVLGVLVRIGSWCDGFTPPMVNGLLASAIQGGQESVFRLVVSLIEEIDRLPTRTEDTDTVYEEMCKHRLPERWFEFFARTAKLLPSMAVMTKTDGAHNTRWLTLKCEPRDSDELKTAIETLVSGSEFGLTIPLLEKYHDILEAEFVADALDVCTALGAS